MPNAKDLQLDIVNFLLSGASGSGKTVLACTAPGRKFAYTFDPGALMSVRGWDVPYEEFLPTDTNIKMASLDKKIANPSTAMAERTYNMWEKDFEDKLNMNWFTDETKEHKGVKGGIKNLIFDSMTTFSDIATTEIQIRNGRLGLPPDYEHEFFALISLISRIVRRLTSLGVTVIMTAHERTKQDELTKRILSEILVVGQLRQKLPILFDEVYHLEVREEGGKGKHKVLTRPNSIYQVVATRLGAGDKFELWEDVTVDYNKPIEGQGLAALIKKARGAK